ncbi:hypothetical protein DFJ43DRAFT_733155 [Lentinula guzmanii]|uniref:Uncharacterized protein n=1 Tax=Lentinula guzmanii TaxID=2804957 RepID=A0AA38MW19_9AGAR|nr:hypothetical protein DFJ43DRAFT_733155 [Lentinula guzmanii]
MSQVYGFRAKIDYEAPPKDNLNWPWVVENETKRLQKFSQLEVVSLQDRQTSSGKIPRGPLDVQRDLFHHVETKLAFQGHFHFISAAVHFLHEQQYIQDLPQDFDALLKPLLAEEKANLASFYEKEVRGLYADEHTNKEELVRWELHRLLENNCETYKRNLDPKLPPADLVHLIEYSQVWCVSAL